MKDTSSILLNKMKLDKLAHLVTFHTTGNTENQTDLLKTFIYDLCLDYLGFEKNLENKVSKLLNHPDLLIIGDERPEEKAYIQEELSEVYSFLNHRPLKAQTKIIIINNAHLLNDLNSNKLLKIFEEPPIPCYIFLLNPKGIKLLPTIESRSIKISLKLKEDLTQHDQEFFIEELKKLSLAAFLELINNNSDFKERAFLELLTSKLTTHCKTAQDAEFLAELIKKWEKALEFRMPMNTRLTRAFYGAQKIFRL